MELRNIMTFLKIAETGSFTRAAGLLGYNQSTVTVQIQQLEQELGVMLFDRVGRRISLTEKGYEFLGYANEIAHSAMKASAIGQKDKEISGLLRVGVVEELTTPTLFEMLRLYISRFPGVELDFTAAPALELLAALRSGERDLVFVLAPPKEHVDLIRIWNRQERAVFVTSPSADSGENENSAEPRALSLTQLCTKHLILPAPGSSFRDLFDQIAAEAQLKPSSLITLNNLSAVKQLLANSDMAALLPEYAVREELSRGELRTLAVDCPELHLYSQMFYHRNKWVSPSMQELIDLIARYYGMCL